MIFSFNSSFLYKYPLLLSHQPKTLFLSEHGFSVLSPLRRGCRWRRAAATVYLPPRGGGQPIAGVYGIQHLIDAFPGVHEHPVARAPLHGTEEVVVPAGYVGSAEHADGIAHAH